VEDSTFDTIAQRYGAVLILQFGSTVRGLAHAGSDLDLAVLLDDANLSWRQHAEMHAEFQALFPEREVDLVVLNHADPLLLRTVSDSAVRVYGSERRFQEWKMYAFKRYQDHRPYLELEKRHVQRALGLS
jgi:predicted nucleotidyltransferase